jgi:SAM-dependent methyltransferase
MEIYFHKGCDSVEGRRVLDYLMENSDISPKVADRPSDAGPFQFLYRFESPHTPIDEYYVRSLSATAIHLRMVSLQDNLPGIIRREMARQVGPNGRFLILDVGSGPGDAIRKALRKKHHKDLLDTVEVHCVDSDERSIERGKKLVERDGLSANIKFFNKEMGKYGRHDSYKDANLILVIGLLCPMNNISCVKILSNLYKNIASPNSAIIYSTVQEDMLWGDPLLDAIMRLGGWHMHFKTEEEADLVGTRAKWKIQDTFHDLLNYNRMTIGYK